MIGIYTGFFFQSNSFLLCFVPITSKNRWYKIEKCADIKRPWAHAKGRGRPQGSRENYARERIVPQVEIPHTDIDALVLAFSLERFGRYMDKANQDKELALAFYAHNMQLSESLYSPLQILEVVLRNRIHQVMTSVFGEWWFDTDTVGLQSAEQMHLTKARQDIQRENKTETSGQIVASLSFGFWTGLISPRYDWLWKKHLNAIARKPDKNTLIYFPNTTQNIVHKPQQKSPHPTTMRGFSFSDKYFY